MSKRKIVVRDPETDKEKTIPAKSLSVSVDKVCRVLKPSMALRDRSQLGRMRDYYPLELFTLQNVLTLLEYGLFADALYFMPFTIMLLVVRVPFLRMDFRLRLTNLAFLLFQEMFFDVRCHKEAPQDKNPGKITQRAYAASDMVTFAETRTLERILCTIISYTCAFQLTPEHLRTDALGTHIVEQMIGNGRHGGDPRWERILSTFCQSTLRTVLMGLEGMTVVSPWRLKTAGCCLSSDGEFFIPDFDEGLVAQVLVHGVTPEARIPDDFQTNLKRVVGWFEHFSDVLKIRNTEVGRIWPPSPVANSGILARLIKSSPTACIEKTVVPDDIDITGPDV